MELGILYLVPLTEKFKKIAPNNNMGQIIKVLMITSSGSEGITLKNTRYVHIYRTILASCKN